MVVRLVERESSEQRDVERLVGASPTAAQPLLFIQSTEKFGELLGGYDKAVCHHQRVGLAISILCRGRRLILIFEGRIVRADDLPGTLMEEDEGVSRVAGVLECRPDTACRTDCERRVTTPLVDQFLPLTAGGQKSWAEAIVTQGRHVEATFRAPSVTNDHVPLAGHSPLLTRQVPPRSQGSCSNNH